MSRSATEVPGDPTVQPQASRLALPAIYGLPDDSEVLRWSAVEQRLVAARHYWLSTVTPAGRPYTRPVDGMWLDDSLWFGGSDEAVWRRNLAAHPEVCVNLEDAESAVVVHARVSLATPDLELARRLAAASNQKYDFGQTPEMYLDNPVFRATPRHAVAWSLLYVDATRWDWP